LPRVKLRTISWPIGLSRSLTDLDQGALHNQLQQAIGAKPVQSSPAVKPERGLMASAIKICHWATFLFMQSGA
jgi:hypothetical protein